jgi:hypothetical protein
MRIVAPVAVVAAVAAAVATVAFAAETVRKEDARLRYAVPTAWARVPAPSDMRAAQYRIPKVAGDTEDGELVLFFFGSGQGGTADANLERWYTQFSRPDGKPVKDAAVVTIRTVNGLKVTSVDLSGTYKPAPMGGAAGAPKTDWRMLAAVIEGEGGPWFFRATGPEKTMADAKPEFDALLASVAPH